MEDLQSENYLENQTPTKRKNWFLIILGAVVILSVPILFFIISFGLAMSSGGLELATKPFVLLFVFMISGLILVKEGTGIKIKMGKSVDEESVHYALRFLGYLLFAYLLDVFSRNISGWLISKLLLHGEMVPTSFFFGAYSFIFAVVGFVAYFILIKSQKPLERKLFLGSLVFLVAYLLLPILLFTWF